MPADRPIYFYPYDEVFFDDQNLSEYYSEMQTYIGDSYRLQTEALEMKARADAVTELNKIALQYSRCDALILEHPESIIALETQIIEWTSQ